MLTLRISDLQQQHSILLFQEVSSLAMFKRGTELE